MCPFSSIEHIFESTRSLEEAACGGEEGSGPERREEKRREEKRREEVRREEKR
jgi:hypothetical protein